MVVRDGRIVAVKPRVEAIAGAVVIDATGKFLIPGLWDMHMHITAPQIVFPLLVANGITGVREMYSGTPLATIRQWRLLPDAPRYLAPGVYRRAFDVVGWSSAGCLAVANAEQARAAVRALAAARRGFLESL